MVQGDAYNPLCNVPVGLDRMFNMTGTGALDSGLVDTGSCTYSVGGVSVTGEAQGRGKANPLGSRALDVSAFSLTDGQAATSHVESDSFATVVLNAPEIDYTGGVTVVVGTFYSLFVQSGNLNWSGRAKISFQVGTIDGNPLSFGPNGQKELTSATTISGPISDQFTIVACPCSFGFEVTALTDAGNGAAAVADDDPFFVQLPPGWTYTLSSEASAVPEPGSLTLTALGVFVACYIHRRRRSGPPTP